MTDDEKVGRMVEWLTSSHLHIHGGYEYGHDWIGHTLVVADLDEGKDRQRTTIERYTRKQLIDWYDRAEEYLKATDSDMKWPEYASDFGDWNEAFFEEEQKG